MYAVNIGHRSVNRSTIGILKARTKDKCIYKEKLPKALKKWYITKLKLVIGLDPYELGHKEWPRTLTTCQLL